MAAVDLIPVIIEDVIPTNISSKQVNGRDPVWKPGRREVSKVSMCNKVPMPERGLAYEQRLGNLS